MTLAPEREPLEFETIEDVLAALRGAGHRVTMPAKAVLEALFAASGPLAAEELAPELEPAIVGVNCRDLRTMEVSLDTAVALAPLIPDQVVAVVKR